MGNMGWMMGSGWMTATTWVSLFFGLGLLALVVIGIIAGIAYKHIGLIGRSTLEARIEEALQGVIAGKAGQGRKYQSVR